MITPIFYVFHKYVTMEYIFLTTSLCLFISIVRLKDILWWSLSHSLEYQACTLVSKSCHTCLPRRDLWARLSKIVKFRLSTIYSNLLMCHSISSDGWHLHCGTKLTKRLKSTSIQQSNFNLIYFLLKINLKWQERTAIAQRNSSSNYPSCAS